MENSQLIEKNESILKMKNMQRKMATLLLETVFFSNSD